MKQFWQHKWVIGVGALVLVAALGAIAWAAPGDTTTTAPTVTPQQGAIQPQGPDPDHMGPGMFGAGMLRHGRGGPGVDVDPEQFQQDREQRQADRQARRDAFLKLIREKMTPEDQQKLDSLSATAKQQQAALEAARQSLHKTTTEMRALVGKYFPEGTSPDSGSPSTAPSTSTPSTSTN